MEVSFSSSTGMGRECDRGIGQRLAIKSSKPSKKGSLRIKLIGNYVYTPSLGSFIFVGRSSLLKRCDQLPSDNRGKWSLLKKMYKLRCAVEFVVGIDGIGSELSLGLSWRGEYCSWVKGTFVLDRWVCRRMTIRVLRFRRISTMLNIGNCSSLVVT